MYTCEYCQTVFTAKSSLSRHQKRTKYCLQARGLETKEFICSCGIRFSREDNLQQHRENCANNKTPPQSPLQKEHVSKDDELVLKIMDKYENMFKELQKQNGLLQEQLVEISSRPTVTNNSNVVLNNLQPITDEDLQENLDNLKLDFILAGAKGYANYAKFYPLKDNVICTDKARKKIKYKNEDGEVTDDSRLLARRFFQAISERNKDILDTAYKDIHEEVKEIVAENRAGEADITGLLTKAAELQNILIRSQRAATGEDDEFTQEFLGHLAKML